MRPEYTPEFIESLYARIDRSGGPDACWPWLGATNKAGYGIVGVNRRCQLVHRIIYIVENGRFPDDKPCGLHDCDNPPCCNPTHVFPGTRTENNRDRHRKGRSGSHKGALNGRAKLTEDTVRLIKSKFVPGQYGCVARLAREFGMPDPTIRDIIDGRTWQDVK